MQVQFQITNQETNVRPTKVAVKVDQLPAVFMTETLALKGLNCIYAKS